MRSEATSPNDYFANLPAERKVVMERLRTILKKNLPNGFDECMAYGMPTFVVPLKTYPKGYHVSPNTPLGFISIASQKNFIAFYHMGLYGNAALLKWFVDEYPKHCTTKLDMGKACVRFKNLNEFPFDLIAELAKKVSPEQWITWYEKALNRK
jgi:uncharacterized protein YdhG (YjbR/CyaY superfamily)